MWCAILKIAFVDSASRCYQFSVAVALILVEVTLVYVSFRSRELTLRGALALLKSALVARAIWEDHFTGAVLSSSVV